MTHPSLHLSDTRVRVKVEAGYRCFSIIQHVGGLTKAMIAACSSIVAMNLSVFTPHVILVYIPLY